MAQPKQNEPVYFFEWNGTGHDQFDATLRVIVAGGNSHHPKVHLTVLRADETFDNVNNIENVEIQDDMAGISYWLTRYAEWPLP